MLLSPAISAYSIPSGFGRPLASSRKRVQAPKTGKPRRNTVFHGGFLMATTILNPMSRTTASVGQQAELIELVRGREKELLAWLSPLVRRQSVTLDLRSVERIDAAGVAALVSLYSSARQAGHRFTVAHPSPRVAEVLALVGLERILLLHRAAWKSHSSPRFERTAA
jgi:anti-anti-sigma factor